IRNGCTVIALTSPAQVFQITAIGSATSLTVTPAANPAIPAGTKYAILLSDSLSVDGLAQDIAETFTMYQRYMSGFADVMNGTTDVTITINGVAVTVPGQKSLAKKGANNDITSLSGLTTALSISQGGTGAKNASDARANLGAAKSGDNEDITLIRGLKGRAQLWADTDYSTGTLVSYTGTTVGAIVRATTSIVATSTYAASASFGFWIDANSIGSSGPMLASTGSQQNRWIFRNSSGAISTANGDITPSVCDERVKNIIREITEEEAVEFISGLKPIRYTLKWAPEKVKVGYSAQNVEALDSELISVSALTVIDPESGESTTYEDGKIIDPGEVGAAYLVPAVKQLLRRVSELEEKLNLKSAQS
ncbi:tail fiber domain-containing protein, partial [Enterobacter hormaechei]